MSGRELFKPSNKSSELHMLWYLHFLPLQSIPLIEVKPIGEDLICYLFSLTSAKVNNNKNKRTGRMRET